MKKAIVFVLAVILTVTTVMMPVQAITPVYSVSSGYRSGVFYDRLLNVTLTGDYATDIVNVALSQVGYHEGNNSSELNGSNKTGNQNITEYCYYCNGYTGDYPWCAYFVVWCARQAGIGSDIIKKTGYATADDFGVTYKGRPADRSSGIDYTPLPGDLIIFDWGSDGYSSKTPASNYGDHVGIVIKVENGYVYTVEGNSDNEVRQNRYLLSSEDIKGYGVPSYNDSTQIMSAPIYDSTSMQAQVVSYATSQVGTSWDKGLCQAWVNDCIYHIAGTHGVSTCCAYAAWLTYGVSSSDSIPLGAAVYFGGGSITDRQGHLCGHVGIYVGDGYIVHGGYSSYVRKDKISDILKWNSSMYYLGWGWQANVALENNVGAGIPTIQSVTVSGSNVSVSWSQTNNAEYYDVFLIQEPWGWPDVRYQANGLLGTTYTFTDVADGYYQTFVIARPNDNQAQSTWVECIVHTHTPGPDATCTTNQICTSCGAILADAKSHMPAPDAAVPATCTADGRTEGSHCSVCGTVLTAQQTIPATDHHWNDGEITTQPTAVSDGVKTYTCMDCGATKTEAVKSNRLPGDLNGDGTVTTVDVAMLNAYVRGVLFTLSDEQLACADVVGNDGVVTTVDVARINAHVRGTAPLF